MARSPVQDIIELGKALEAASGVIAKKDSLEQACREAESRLQTLRDDESKASASIAAAHAEAEKIVSDARSSAYSITEKAQRDAAEKWNDCETKCADREAKAASEAVKAENRVAEAVAKCKRLEKEETALAQSVASLREALTALKAKLG